MSKFSIIKEFFLYIKTEKKFWLAPLIIIFLVLSFLIVVTQSSAVAPFIYALF